MTFTISFDPGTHTGYALWQDKKLVNSGVLHIDWKQPASLHEYTQALGQLLIGVEQVWAEKEYEFWPKNKSKVFLARYHKSHGVLQGKLSDIGIPTKFVDTRKMAKKRRAQSIVCMMFGEKPIEFKRKGKLITKYPHSTHECEAILLGMKEQGLQILVVSRDP